MTRYLFFAVLIFGCNQNESNDLNSLDNFALGSDVHINECKAPDNLYQERLKMAGEITVTTPPNLKNAENYKSTARTALTALPPELLRSFKALQGEVVLDPDVKKSCSNFMKQFASTEIDYETCQYYTIDANGKVKVTLVMPPSESVIAHNIVKSFGYAFSQFGSYLRISSDRKISVDSSKSFAMGRIQDELSRAFLMDIGTFRHQGMFDSLQARYFTISDPKSLSEFMREQTGADLLSGKGDIYKFIKFKSADLKTEFDDWVFSHSMDSYFCNTSAGFNYEKAGAALYDKNLSQDERNSALKNTSEVMKNFFGYTFSVFQERLPEIYSLGSFLEISNPPEISSAGFGLQGFQSRVPNKEYFESLTPEQTAALVGPNNKPFDLENYQIGNQYSENGIQVSPRTPIHISLPWGIKSGGGVNPEWVSQSKTKAYGEFWNNNRTQIEATVPWRPEQELYDEALSGKEGVGYPAWKALQERKYYSGGTHSNSSGNTNMVLGGISASSLPSANIGFRRSSTEGSIETNTRPDLGIDTYQGWRAAQTQNQSIINQGITPATPGQPVGFGGGIFSR